LRWMDGETLRFYLLEHYLYTGNPRALLLAQRPLLCALFSITVMTWELSFWAVIFWPALTWVYVTIGLLFHTSTSLLMRIHYWVYFCPVYLVFFAPPLERGLNLALGGHAL
jgi:hypothetical protein